MKTHIRNRESGFTLIEYIVGLVIVSFIAAMIYNIMGTSLTKSSSPIQNLQKASALSMVMENIIADYNQLNEINMRYKWRSAQAYHLNSIVLPSTGDDNDASTIKNNGRYYKCTTAGTSSANQPVWPTVDANTKTLGRTVTDGTVVWTEQGYVWKANQQYPANAIVVPDINDGHYYKGPSSPNPFTSGANVTSTWPTGNNGTVTDGGVTWTEAGTILYSADTTNAILKDNLKYYLTTTPGRYDNNKNSYTVVETKFIQFNTSTQKEENTSSENNILKVTIKDNNSGRTLTEIFTIR